MLFKHLFGTQDEANQNFSIWTQNQYKRPQDQDNGSQSKEKSQQQIYEIKSYNNKSTLNTPKASNKIQNAKDKQINKSLKDASVQALSKQILSIQNKLKDLQQPQEVKEIKGAEVDTIDSVQKTKSNSSEKKNQAQQDRIQNREGDNNSLVNTYIDKKADSPKYQGQNITHDMDSKLDQPKHNIQSKDQIGKKRLGSTQGSIIQKQKRNKEGSKIQKLQPPVKTVEQEELDEEKLQRTIFIGNIPLNIDIERLKQIFGIYGKISSVRIRSVPIDITQKLSRRAAILKQQFNSKRASSNGFIVFSNQEEAQKALDYNMKLIDDHHIIVDKASPPSKQADNKQSVKYDPKKSIFIGNLSFEIEEEDLIQLFKGSSGLQGLEDSVQAVRVIRDPKTNIGKGIAYVLFKKREFVNLALQLEGKVIKNRPLRITRVKKDPQKTNINKQQIKPRDDKQQSQAQQIKTKQKKDKLKDKSWQGLKTKGVKKVSRAQQVQKEVKKQNVQPSNRTRQNKRPSIVAKKEKQKALLRKQFYK